MQPQLLRMAGKEGASTAPGFRFFEMFVANAGFAEWGSAPFQPISSGRGGGRTSQPNSQQPPGNRILEQGGFLSLLLSTFWIKCLEQGQESSSPLIRYSVSQVFPLPYVLPGCLCLLDMVQGYSFSASCFPYLELSVCPTSSFPLHHSQCSLSNPCFPRACLFLFLPPSPTAPSHWSVLFCFPALLLLIIPPRFLQN